MLSMVWEGLMPERSWVARREMEGRPRSWFSSSVKLSLVVGSIPVMARQMFCVAVLRGLGSGWTRHLGSSAGVLGALILLGFSPREPLPLGRSR